MKFLTGSFFADCNGVFSKKSAAIILLPRFF